MKTKPNIFSGSYSPEDVIFLMKPIAMTPMSLAEKERRIQTGECHYSEMIGEERLPSPEYLAVFKDGCDRNLHTMALNVIALASIIAENICGAVSLVSLARAGTPVGALLKRALTRYFDRQATHFSISIIRDRGMDENALLYILRKEHCLPESIVFVDGWTGKGVIARELKKAVAVFNAKHGTHLSNQLYVLSDLCGAAGFSPSWEDYLIPSSILNATVSGLVSRSILNARHIGANDFHGCIYYKEFEKNDLSNWFLNQVSVQMAAEIAKTDTTGGAKTIVSPALSEDIRQGLREKSEIFAQYAKNIHGVKNINHVKPGIGEATRVLLRRIPDKLLIKDASHPDVRHLIVLAKEKGVPVIEYENLPYRAAAFIQNLSF